MMLAALVSLALATDLTGSGHAKTEKRAVETFSSIHAIGAMTVEVLPGDKPSVEVTADDNLLAIVETSVKERTLTIKTTQGYTNGTIAVKVWLPQLDAFDRDGSGASSIKGVASKALALKSLGSGALDWNGTADKLTYEALGSGGATLTGKATQVAIKVAGSGNVKAGGLLAKTGTLEVMGSGNVDVNVSDALQVSVMGSGNVTYAGAPKLTKKVLGSGLVKAKDAPKLETTSAPASGW